MLDIQEMIKSNNFADLINSTKQEREQSGGDEHIYSQLADFLHFSTIREVLKETFKDNLEILDHMNNQQIEKKLEVARTILNHDNVDYHIQLP